MRKTILLLATAASFNALTSFATENTFYVKANAGYSKMLNSKIEDKNSDRSIKFKSKNGNGFFGLGFGYYPIDKFRIDLVYDYFLNSTHKHSFSDEDGYFVRNRIKGNINAVTLNGYVDLFDTGNIKLFTGCGLGLAQIKAKGVSSATDEPDTTIKFKTTKNFTYSLHLGASLELAENLHTDLTYSWRDFGEVKGAEEQKDAIMKYRSHNLTLGVRYDV